MTEGLAALAIIALMIFVGNWAIPKGESFKEFRKGLGLDKEE